MRKLLILLLLSLPASAATNNVTAGTIFKLDASTGNDANGGGFDVSSAGGTGTDLTLSAPVVVTGVTCLGTSATTVTQVGGTWTNTMVGNVMQIASGTNFTAGFYTIVTFTDSNNLVLNVTPCSGSAATTGSTRVGGPLLTFAKAVTAVAAGNIVYAKASATYSITASIAIATNGSSGKPISWIGYTTSISDGGPATIQISSGSAVNMIAMAGKTFNVLKGLVLDCNAKTTSTGLTAGGTGTVIDTVQVKGCTATGISWTTSLGTLRNSIISGLTTCSASSGAITLTQTGVMVLNNRFTGNACPGVYDSSAGINYYIGNISDNNTGASSDGFYKSGAGGTFFRENIAYLNGRDGFRLDNAAALDAFSMYNNISWQTGGTCINSTTTNWSSDSFLPMDYNAVGGGCTARANVPTGAHDVALTVDPFVAGGSNNFTLNNTSGGGPLLKSIGFPGALQSGGTGYRDIGPLQSLPVVSSPISQ